ncbi:hypothetical protein ACU6HM_18120 [Alcaligenes sp. RM2]|uniref:hypothetical protein n=1 Tax=Alcaligenes TaxID=507 RepID=UPI0002AA9D06|nr:MULTISPECIES: hypothetical protein [Alcaligenes]EKU30907.1 hypothetical protein C660_05552 [Alcaligenes sp. HPC1271]ERI35110.1 hypothetical protein N879_06195 [Alcaligenes sp. EGD-AK7]URW84014.1 hypothetical protein NBV64_06610 [Alcaligenes sp. DN25]UTM02069.1 hypothetical protein MID00_01195 [Alcaligenes sp. NLF5-7]WEA68853.1 hypothetical protein PWH35_06625 [Alcaligenes faecalis]
MFQGHWQTRASLHVMAQAETTTLSHWIQNRAIWPRSQDTRLKSVLECHLPDLMGPEITVAKAVTEQVEEAIARRLGRAPVD